MTNDAQTKRERIHHEGHEGHEEEKEKPLSETEGNEENEGKKKTAVQRILNIVDTLVKSLLRCLCFLLYDSSSRVQIG